MNLSMSVSRMAKVFGFGRHQDPTMINDQPATDSHDAYLVVDPQYPDIYYQDGKSHINIDLRGRTELGQWLNYLAESPFEHPALGRFHSMEAFCAYIRNPNPVSSDRWLAGLPARRANQRISKAERHIPNYGDILLEANFHKINQNPEMRAAFIKSTLPFRYYYFTRPTDDRYRDHYLVNEHGSAVTNRMLQMFEDLRSLMKAGKQPPTQDYTDFIR